MTDVICLFIFFICFSVSVGFNCYAMINGKMINVYADYDGDGMFCGVADG